MRGFPRDRPHGIDIMKNILLTGAYLAAVLASTVPALGQSAPVVGQIEVGDEPINIKVGDAEGLTYYVTARTRSGVLIKAPRLSFAAVDSSIIEIRGDTAVGVRPGSALVLVKPAEGSRPLVDTLRVTVVEAAAYIASEPVGDSASPPAPGGPPIRTPVPGEPPEPAEQVLSRVPPGAVLKPEPNPLPLLQSEREAIRAVVRRQGDNSILGTVRATYESLSPAIVHVDIGGNVTGVGLGTGIVQVTPVGGDARTVSVTVETVPVQFVRDRVAIPVGEQRTSMVVVPRQGGRVLDNTKLNWSSSSDSVALVGADGMVTGRAPGRAVIIAGGSLGADTLLVVVHPIVKNLGVPPRTRPVVVPLRGTTAHPVIPLGQAGDTLHDVPISWVVADTSVVQLDTAAQTLTGKKVGTTRLTIQVSGFEPAAWTITVIPPGIALAPDRLALSRGERQTLAANMVDNAGQSVAPLTQGQWGSSDPAVVRVGLNGEIQGGTLGRASVWVKGPGERTDTAEVFVVGDLLVSSNRGGQPAIYQLSLANPDSLVPLIADTGSTLIAAYSTDRTRIAVAAVQEKRLAISVMEAAGGQQRPNTILRLAGSKPALAWMPDGQHLVFGVGDKNRATLGMLDLNKGSWDTLAVVEDTLSPSVSGNGTIIYARGDDNRTDLYTIKPPSKVVNRLTNTPFRKSNPRWLPDGDVLFLMEDGREKMRFQIVRFNPKTGTQVVLVRSKEPILTLAVARDGHSMAYTVKEKDKRKPSSLFVAATEVGGRVRTILLRPGETVAALSN